MSTWATPLHNDVLLAVEHISISYEQLLVVSDVSIQVRSERMTCLVGCNGAGKSSVLRAIAGSIPLASGSLFLGGYDITRMSMYQRIKMGLMFIPEGRGLFQHMTVEENLQLMIYMKYFSKKDLHAIYENFPILGKYRSLAAGCLSGGQKQLLAISRSLLVKPRLLIIDEPSLGLSPQMIDIVFSMLRDMTSQGTTVLLVEQNAYKSLSISDDGYIMEKGKIVTHGLTKTLRESSTIRKAYFWDENRVV